MSYKKSTILGENFSTAQGKLRKKILFSLVQRLNLDACYRCTLKIDNISELSIEHKKAWQYASEPIESFYDLENIGFSHLNCNRAAATKHGNHSHKGRITHGTSGYRLGCRCDICKTIYSKDRKLRYIKYKK